MTCVCPPPVASIGPAAHHVPRRTTPDLRTLAASASARASYKAQLQRRYHASPSFQQQCAALVSYFLHQRHHAEAATILSGDGSPFFSVPPSPPSSTATPFSSGGASPMYNELGRGAHHWTAPTTGMRNPYKAFLVPPRPRLSSCLSPSPPNTHLPGPTRRPVPVCRTRVASEPLLRRALRNSTIDRARGGKGDPKVTLLDQGQTWVILPAKEEWEVVELSP